MRKNKKRIIALLQTVVMTVLLFGMAGGPAAAQNDNSNNPEPQEMVGEVFEPFRTLARSLDGVPLSVFSGRLGEWNNVSHTLYRTNDLTLRITSDGEVLYTIVEGANRDTQNVYYISIDGRPNGFTFMGRPNVHYVVANGYVYRVLNDVHEYRDEYVYLLTGVNPVPASGRVPHLRNMPAWFGADDDPDRDAQRLERVGMDYFRTWTGMQLRLDQIGNPDPGDVRISWRGYGTDPGPAGQVAVHLPVNNSRMLPAIATFEPYRPEGVYFPAKDYGIFFNPLRGGGSNLGSDEAPNCHCDDPEDCPALRIHTFADGTPLVNTPGPHCGQNYGYAYITWRSMEQEPGVFDWSQVRMYTKGDYDVVGPNMDRYQCARGFLVQHALEYYAEHGIYVQLRFVMDYPFGSPFGYWYGNNYIGGVFDNSPLGGQESHTELAMINLKNERIADVPRWLIDRMREEPNLPNAACPDNIPNRPDFDPSILDPEHPDFRNDGGLFARMRDPGDPDAEWGTPERNQALFHLWAQRWMDNGYFHCTIPNPHGGADLRICPNGCVPYRRPAGLTATPNADRIRWGWHPSYFWGPEGIWYLTPPPQISGGVGMGPRYAHHLLLDYHERAINALAEEIARPGSPWNAVANVQLGSLGRWGEWHNWPAGDGSQFPDSAVAYQFVRHYIDAFASNPNIDIGMRYHNWIAARYNLGAFNDQTGHTGNLTYVNAYAGQNLSGNNADSRAFLANEDGTPWLGFVARADGHPGHGGGTGFTGNENANMGPWNRNDAHLFTGFTSAGGFTNATRNPTHWMHGWVGGEYGDQSVPTNWGWQYVQFDVARQGDLHRGAMHSYGNGTAHTRIHIMNTIDSFRWSHISNLAPRGPDAGRTNATTGDMQRAHANNDAAYDNMGYQFFIEEVEIVDGELARGESADVRMVVNNIGVAPFYRSWPFEVSFIDENGNVAATQVIEDVDITTWMPRHRPINNARPAPQQYRYVNGIRIEYRSAAELQVLGDMFIPAHDGRNEFTFTVDVPRSLSRTGEYTMAVAILDPILLNMNPGIWFHNLANRDDRRVLLEPFVVGLGAGEQFFIAPDGDNTTGDGTKENPWATVAHAITQMDSGDTLNIRSGIYSEAITVPTRLSGNSVLAPCTNEFNFFTQGCICEEDPHATYEVRNGVLYCTLNERGNTVFRAYPGDPEKTVIFRRAQIGGDAFRFNNVQNITVEGIRFEGFSGGIRQNASAARPATGLENIYVRNNTVAYNRAGNSINIYNQPQSAAQMSSMRNVVIEGNLVHDGRSGHTETVVVNGNVNGIVISHNQVHNNNNIAIDLIGWETSNNVPEAFLVNRARNILVHDNVIHGTKTINGHQTYRRPHSEWGFPPPPLGNYDPCSVGIYFDSGLQGRIFNNFIFDNDIGISISSERVRGNLDGIVHPVTGVALPQAPNNTSGGMGNNTNHWYLTNVHVHDNIIATTQGEGAISIGGYSAHRTETFDIVIENNILFNDRWAFLIQNSHDNIIRNNVIVSEQMEHGYGSRQGAGRFLPWPSFPAMTENNPGGDYWNFSRLPQPWTANPHYPVQASGVGPDGVGRNYLELPAANDFQDNFWFADDPEFYFNGPTTWSLFTIETYGHEAAAELGGFFERMRVHSPAQYARQHRLTANPLVDPAAGNFDFTPEFLAAHPNAGTNWRPPAWALELFAESFNARIEVEAAKNWLEGQLYNIQTDILDEGYVTLDEFLTARLQEAGFENTEVLYSINAAPGHATRATSAGWGMYLYDGGHGTMAVVRNRELIRGLHAGWGTGNSFNVTADNNHAAQQVPWRALAPGAPNEILNGFIHADRVAALETALADGTTDQVFWSIKDGASYREFAWEVQLVTRFGPDCAITGEPRHYASAATYSCRYYGMDRVTGVPFTQAAPNGGVRLYVGEKAEPTEITVTFNPTGGIVAKDYRVVTIGETFGGAFPMPSRPGYVFTGWFTAPEGGTRIMGTHTVVQTTNITLYAQWRHGGDITITFNPTGGSVHVTSRVVTAGAANFGGAFPMPTRPGYVFEGWFTAVTGGTRVLGTSRVAFDSDTTLFARWRAENSIVVTFNPNGGTVSPTTRIAVPGAANYGGAFPRPLREGYVFAGWFTVPAATGGTRVLGTNPVTQTADFTLYARWTPSATIVVTFNPTGGTVNPTSRVVTVGDIYGGAFPTPTRPGHVFAGWFTAEVGGVRIMGTNTVTHAADFTLYARWTTPGMAVKIDLLEPQ